MDEILQKIEDKKTELNPIYNRQKQDIDLYLLSKYVMVDNLNQIIPDAHSVTLNNPATYGENVIATLSSMNEQLEIYQSKQKEDARVTDIENFGADLDYEIDKNLNLQGFSGSMSYIQWSRSCIRGSVASQIQVQVSEDGKDIDFDITPIDTYAFQYEHGRKGLTWGSHQVKKSTSWVKENFPLFKEEDTSKVVIITNYFDDETHNVYYKEELIYDEENIYGYPPYVFQQVPSGPQIDDDIAFQHQGESIFWLCRDIYPELNHMASVLATISHKTIFGDLQLEETDPHINRKQDYELGNEGKYHRVEKGGGFKPMPLSDINNAVRLWWSIIREVEQNGSLSQANYGNIPFPMANSALVNLMASRDKILVPRIQCYSMYKQALLRMVIKQLLQLGKPFTIGEEGFQRTYDLKMFDTDFSIKYRFISQSKEALVANSQVAAQLAPFFPLRYLRSEVFQSSNPDELERQMLVERAEKENPYLLSRAKAHALAEEGRTTDAWAEAYIARKILRDILMGLYQPQQQPAEKGVPSPPKEAAGGRTQPPGEQAKAMKELTSMGAQ